MNHSRFGVAIVTILALVSVPAFTQTRDPLDRVALMIGKWEGTGEGKPGKSTVRREYSRALRSKFIRAVHWGEYPPQEKNPKGEIHEDEGFFSFDRSRRRLVFRQFHAEGFVNTYVEEGDSTPTKIVFTTEVIENIPAGWRARETYFVHSPDEIEEVFELAEPGAPFEVYSRTRLKRIMTYARRLYQGGYTRTPRAAERRGMRLPHALLEGRMAPFGYQCLR